MKLSRQGIWKGLKVITFDNRQALFHLSCTRAPFHCQALCTHTRLLRLACEPILWLEIIFVKNELNHSQHETFVRHTGKCSSLLGGWTVYLKRFGQETQEYVIQWLKLRLRLRLEMTVSLSSCTSNVDRIISCMFKEILCCKLACQGLTVWFVAHITITLQMLKINPIKRS